MVAGQRAFFLVAFLATAFFAAAFAGAVRSTTSAFAAFSFTEAIPFFAARFVSYISDDAIT